MAFGCTACATLAERQKAEGGIRRAEEEKETRQEQYRDLGDSISDVTPPALLCLTIPTEPQAQVVPEVDAQVYDRIVVNSPAEAINERHLRVGGSITLAAAIVLTGVLVASQANKKGSFFCQ